MLSAECCKGTGTEVQLPIVSVEWYLGPICRVSLRDWGQLKHRAAGFCLEGVSTVSTNHRPTTPSPRWSYRSTESMSNVFEMLVWRAYACQCTSSTTLHCTENNWKFEHVWSRIILTSWSNACIGHHEQNFSGSAAWTKAHSKAIRKIYSKWITHTL